MKPSRNIRKRLKRDAEDTPGAFDASVSSPLGEALENKDILLKVLGCVAEDGLQECRLVCRRWLEACQRVPVATRPIELTHLSKVANKFTNITDLYLDQRQKYPFSQSLDGIDILDTLSTWLPRLKGLRTLKLFAHEGNRIPEALCPILAPMDGLQSLSLRLLDESSLITWIQVLRGLPQLLSLELLFSGFVNTDLETVSELQKLRDLTCEFRIFVKRDGQLLFPTLNRLTRLEICRWNILYGEPSVMNLEILKPYAASLHVLDLTDLSECQLLRGSALLAFSQLHTLKISLPKLKDLDVLLVLPKLHRLKELRNVGRTYGLPLSFLDSVVALTELKSLCLDISWMSTTSRDMMTVFAVMPQLTSLALKGIDDLGTTLHCLTALVSLTVESRCTLSPCIADAISSLQHLTSIRLLDREGKFKLPSAALKPLKKLKTLTLGHVLTEPDFAETLAMLSTVTELQFEPNHSMHLLQFYPQLGLLSSLIVLRIPCDLKTIEMFIRPLAGRLPKLRKLQFCRWMRGTTSDFFAVREKLERPVTKSALFNAFPNIHRVSIISLPNSVIWSGTEMRKICYSDLFI